MSYPCRWSSSGTGRTLLWKLNSPCAVQPIHSAKSFAFAKLVASATIRVRLSVWLEMYRIREMHTSRTGPTSPPIRWSSSTMRSATLCTFLRCFHLRLSMSHRCGVVTTMVARSNSFRSVAVSPVSSSTVAPSGPNLARHSLVACSASGCSGVTRTARPPGVCWSMRKIANSAQIVLPEPVGAPTSTLSSELKRVWKVCVWIGLKCEKAEA